MPRVGVARQAWLTEYVLTQINKHRNAESADVLNGIVQWGGMPVVEEAKASLLEPRSCDLGSALGVSRIVWLRPARFSESSSVERCCGTTM